MSTGFGNVVKPLRKRDVCIAKDCFETLPVRQATRIGGIQRVAKDEAHHRKIVIADEEHEAMELIGDHRS